MLVRVNKSFTKAYDKRFANNRNLVRLIDARVQIFLEDPFHPLLKTHQLKGEKRDFWAFSVTGDIRVIFSKVDDTYTLFDIGTHNQVY
jgi:mRNA-degrading endonuclease YafQ of YafQ-DinJ toxin-antitoxin module